MTALTDADKEQIARALGGHVVSADQPRPCPTCTAQEVADAIVQRYLNAAADAIEALARAGTYSAAAEGFVRMRALTEAAAIVRSLAGGAS